MRAKIPGFAAKAKTRFSAHFADEARFIKAWIDNPSLTGAVSPSGKQLAMAPFCAYRWASIEVNFN